MSQPVELTDDLLRETYFELYIGQSESLASCAQILDIKKPEELRQRWETDLGLRMRTKPQAMSASRQKGKLWVWPPDVANPDPEAEAEPADTFAQFEQFVSEQERILAGQDDTPLAEALVVAIPDTGRETYANGNPEPAAEKPKKKRPRSAKKADKTPAAVSTPAPAKAPDDEGPGRRAVQITMPPLKEGETIAFRIKDGEVLGVQRRPAAYDPYAQIRERITQFAAEVADIAHVEVTETITLTIKVGAEGGK